MAFTKLGQEILARHAAKSIYSKNLRASSGKFPKLAAKLPSPEDVSLDADLAVEQQQAINDLKRGAGVVGIGGGGLLAKRMADRGHLTGRETLYHGTSVANAKGIREKGLLPVTEVNAGITKVLKSDPERYQKSLGKVYFHRDWMNAKGSGVLRALTEANGGNPVNAMGLSPIDVIDGARKSEVVKANAPIWKMKTVMNPEVDMPYDEWANKVKGLFMDKDDPRLRSSYDSLRKAVVVDGAMPSDFIKGSKNYKGLSLSELKEFIKANPGRFGKGLAGVAGGLGTMGAGAYLLRDSMRGKGKAKKS